MVMESVTAATRGVMSPPSSTASSARHSPAARSASGEYGHEETPETPERKRGGSRTHAPHTAHGECRTSPPSPREGKWGRGSDLKCVPCGEAKGSSRASISVSVSDAVSAHLLGIMVVHVRSA